MEKANEQQAKRLILRKEQSKALQFIRFAVKSNATRSEKTKMRNSEMVTFPLRLRPPVG
jgi:hypothetical protein